MTKKRFSKDYSIDGWPIVDNEVKSILGTDDLVKILNELAEKSERATPIESGKNRYGVDVAYFRNLINRELNQPLADHTPSELARVCARIAKAADSDVLLEPEFSDKPRFTDDPIADLAAVMRHHESELPAIDGTTISTSAGEIIILIR